MRIKKKDLTSNPQRRVDFSSKDVSKSPSPGLEMTKAQQIKLHKSAQKAMREAVKNVILEHKKNDLPLAIWKNGKVVNISAKKLK